MFVTFVYNLFKGGYAINLLRPRGDCFIVLFDEKY